MRTVLWVGATKSLLLYCKNTLNVFLWSMLSFKQYKNHKSSKMLLTGPFNVNLHSALSISTLLQSLWFAFNCWLCVCRQQLFPLPWLHLHLSSSHQSAAFVPVTNCMQCQQFQCQPVLALYPSPGLHWPDLLSGPARFVWRLPSWCLTVSSCRFYKLKYTFHPTGNDRSHSACTWIPGFSFHSRAAAWTSFGNPEKEGEFFSKDEVAEFNSWTLLRTERERERTAAGQENTSSLSTHKAPGWWITVHIFQDNEKWSRMHSSSKWLNSVKSKMVSFHSQFWCVFAANTWLIPVTYPCDSQEREKEVQSERTSTTCLLSQSTVGGRATKWKQGDRTSYQTDNTFPQKPHCLRCLEILHTLEYDITGIIHL